MNDLPYQLKKMGSMIDQTSIMTVGVINNIKKISGDFTKKASFNNIRRASLMDINKSLDNGRRDISRRSSMDISKRSSLDNSKRSSLEGRRLSVNDLNNRRLSSSRIRRSSSIDQSNRKLSSDKTRKTSFDNNEFPTNKKKKGITFNNTIDVFDESMRYRYQSQQALKTPENDEFQRIRRASSTNNFTSLHPILRHNEDSQNENEDEDVKKPKPLHSKRLSITFNPIVESNVFTNEEISEESDDSDNDGLVDGIKPLSQSYGITKTNDATKSSNNDSSQGSFSQFNPNQNPILTSTSTKSNNSNPKLQPQQPKRSSVYELKKKNSIHDIVQLYSKDNIRKPNSSNEDIENTDNVPNNLKPKDSFLNEDYKFEVLQRRRLSEQNRRRSMYSNGRISISQNLKSSDSLNDEIDSFHITHIDFNRIVGLRYNFSKNNTNIYIYI